MEIVGRDAELDEVSERLARSRLVTITGPGGIGKTTLARAAAQRAEGGYPLGAHTIDLARIDAGSDVGDALATQLGFASFEALLRSPTEQPALVLIDNCEHVLDSAADAIAALLAACRSPTVLATSRSPLDLPEESVMVVGPLGLPPPGLPDSDAPAVRLFLHRARDAGASVATEQLDDVAAVCRLLDGVPLAIELAAARTRSMTPAELIARLDDLDILSRPRFRGPLRHRGLRPTIEWSYELLDPDDRRCFDWLGVLAGPFTLQDAHAVTGRHGDAEAATLARLERLVAASMLTTEPVAGVTHYRQLDMLRRFANERLVARGERDAAWLRFVERVVDRSAIVATANTDGWDAAALALLTSRIEHHLTVLQWCNDNDPVPDRSFTLVATLWAVVHQGHVDRVAPLAAQALERWQHPDHPLWADAVSTYATCRYLKGDARGAIALAEQALPRAQPGGYAACTLRRAIAHAAAALGDLPASIAAFDAAIGLATGHLDALAMEMTVSRAQIAGLTGDVEGGLQATRTVRRRAEASGAAINAVWAHTVEASLLGLDAVEVAAQVAADALAAARRIPYPACESVNLHTLAELALAVGDHDAARRYLADLVEGLVMRGAEGELRNALHTTAALLQRLDDGRWRPLAAAAAAMPVVSLFNLPGHARFTLPAIAGQAALPIGEVIRIGREALREGASPTSTVGARAPSAADILERSAEPSIRRLGDVWTIAYAGTEISVRASKGVADLARLLAAPHAELHCLDLAGGGVEEGSTGELLDETARRQYEQRVRDLQAEIDAADADADLARAERLRIELDALVDHLTAALGLGRRSRRHTDSTERARSAVTQRVRSTIKRLERQHRPLAAHLKASIRTGLYCSYQPEHPTTWRVDLERGDEPPR